MEISATVGWEILTVKINGDSLGFRCFAVGCGDTEFLAELLGSFATGQQQSHRLGFKLSAVPISVFTHAFTFQRFDRTVHKIGGGSGGRDADSEMTRAAAASAGDGGFAGINHTDSLRERRKFL